MILIVHNLHYTIKLDVSELSLELFVLEIELNYNKFVVKCVRI